MQHLELTTCGMTMDLARGPSPGSLSSEGSRHCHWGHARAPSGPAVLERLDQMDKSLESVSRAATKAKVISLLPCWFTAGKAYVRGVALK